jgi:hypothetical protein
MHRAYGELTLEQALTQLAHLAAQPLRATNVWRFMALSRIGVHKQIDHGDRLAQVLEQHAGKTTLYRREGRERLD